MKNKKSVIAIVAIVAILIASMFLLTGCGSSDTKEENKATNTTSNTNTQSASNTSSSATNTSTETSNVIQLPVNVVNSCPNTQIKALYLSGAGQDNWGSELLNGQVINTNEQLSLTLNIDKNNVKWDIKATDETGTEIEFRNLDLSNVSTSGATITLAIDESGSPVAVAQ